MIHEFCSFEERKIKILILNEDFGEFWDEIRE
jgi:hypothetical protein